MPHEIRQSMSSENRGGNSAPVYTVSPGTSASGGFQNGGNYGFRDDLLRQPPPRYEDVVSGEYLNVNYTNPQPSPGHPTTSVNGCSTPPPPPPLPSESERYYCEGHKEKTCNTGWAFLVALLLCIIFIWRTGRQFS